MPRRNGQGAIVTGASRGIGAAVAQRLASDGFNVVINYAGRPEEAEAQVGIIRQSGGTAVAVRADVSNPAETRHLFDEAEKQFGDVDALVNNAGIMQLSTLADADDALFDRHNAVNLKGVFNGMREAAKRMKSGGRIISFSSSVVGLYQPTYGIYAATKAGVEAMTLVLANELRGRNITANVVAPGPTGTDLFLTGKSPELVERLSKAAPLERLGQPRGSTLRALPPMASNSRMAVSRPSLEGVPLKGPDGETVGAVGVSGGAVPQDLEIAEAAVAAFNAR